MLLFGAKKAESPENHNPSVARKRWLRYQESTSYFNVPSALWVTIRTARWFCGVTAVQTGSHVSMTGTLGHNITLVSTFILYQPGYTPALLLTPVSKSISQENSFIFCFKISLTYLRE